MEEVSDDLQSNGVSFIWKIHKYSYCIQKRDEFLESPALELNGRKCYFRLCPFSPNEDSLARIQLCLLAGNICNFSSIWCKISILKTSGLFQELGLYETAIPINSGAYLSKLRYLKLPCFQKDRYGFNDYLCNDTLTVKFRLFDTNNIVLDPQICCAYTVINVQRTVCNWKIDTVCNYNKITFPVKAASNLFHLQGFTLDASLVEDESTTDGSGKFEVVIKRSNGYKLLFSTCTISIVEDDRILHSKQKEHLFERQQAEQIWNISYTPNINFFKRNKNDCKRFLRLEFATSDGSISVERMENGSTIKSVLSLEPPQHSVSVRSWKDNLQRFQSEGKLINVTLRTSAKEFPAHKALLCAQSKVFSAMFEHNTKENQTGIVEIEDLEDETVSRMLDFVYTGAFKNIDWETATMLYFAADKYEMMALKEQCSMFLKANLSTLNVCNCLILADMHQDQPFKSFVQKFVRKHSSDILKSAEWKEFMKNYVNLAAETMYLMCLKSS